MPWSFSVQKSNHRQDQQAEGRGLPLAFFRFLVAETNEPLAFFVSSEAEDPYGSFQWMLAWGRGDLPWSMGYLPYHFRPEPGSSPALPPTFFHPAGILALTREGNMVAEGNQPPGALEEAQPWVDLPAFKAAWSKAEYLRRFEQIRYHLYRGDIYEANLCMPFEAVAHRFNQAAAFERLVASNQAPFSAFLRLEEEVLISASPERFLCKRGEQLVAQPMKGTLRRTPQTRPNDLRNSTKERAENVMIVDLFRHDLSRSAQKDSVQVEELFGVYPYGPVYQMISTITSRVRPDCSPLQPLMDAFPPGSMTGAPKKSAMSILDEVEGFERGAYAGALGYITPEGNHDFSVIIRTLQYQPSTGKLTLSVGSAITALAHPEEEYAECMVKAHSIFKPLEVPVHEIH